MIFSLYGILSMYRCNLPIDIFVIKHKQFYNFALMFDRLVIIYIDLLASQISVITEFADRFTAFEDRVASVEQVQPNVKINVDNLAFELQERIYRSSNNIVYGLPESRNISDHDAIMQIILPMPGLDLASVTATRSHRQAGDGPRFITVRLSSAQDALRVLLNRRLLREGIGVTADRTLAQREQFCEVKREVEEHNAVNPNNLKIIKYINGVPKAVFARNPKPTNN